ncbi:MAG: HDOD domain-containing protein [Methylotenera sp.]|nr:HDOD domain-containing protein [Methylotenera sp.]
MADVEAFFNTIVTLPSLPKVVQEVMQMLDSEDLAVNALARKVEHDAAISAKVLKLANSSYYGVTRAIKNIDDAIAILGLNKLRSLVIASGVTSAVTQLPGLDLKAFWRHSLVTASVGREIAKMTGRDAELAYIAGLLSNIGRLLMHLVFAKAAVEIDAICHGSTVDERQVVEQARVGVDHCQLGEALANRWNFPGEISRVLRYYATPLDQNACDMAPIVYIAVHIASGLEQGEAAKPIVETLRADVAKVIKWDEIEWIDRIESYRGLVGEAEAFL